MISSKVVITYKRKQSSSQVEPAHGIRGSKSSPDVSRSIRMRFSEKAESSMKCSPEKQKGDDERRIPRRKQPCRSCSELHDSGKSVQQQVHEPRRGNANKCIDASEMGPITLRSRKVLLSRNPGENSSSKQKDYSLEADLSVEMKPDSVQTDLSPYATSGSACKVEQKEGTTGFRVVDMENQNLLMSSCLDLSAERKSTPCSGASVLKTCPSENNDLSASDALPKRFSSTLITFSRRAKKKEHTDGVDISNISAEENRFSPVKWSDFTLGASNLDEGSSQKCNFIGQSTTVASSRQHMEMSPSLLQRQDEMAGKEVDGSLSSTHAGDASETKIAELHATQEQNTDVGKGSIISITEAVTMSRETIRLRDISGDACHEAHIEPSVTPVPNWVSNQSVQKSEPPRSDSLPSDFTSSQSTTNSANVMQPSSSKPSSDIMPIPQDAIVLHKTANKGVRGLELAEIPNEMRPESSYHHTQKVGNLFSSADEGGINNQDACDGKTSSMPLLNFNVQVPCQQNLSGDILHEVVPLACIPHEPTTCLDFQGRTFLSQSGIEKNIYKQASTKSSLCPPHFLGLSLPSKPDTVRDFLSTTSPTSIGIKNNSRIHDHQLGFQDLLTQSAVQGNLSLMRHKQLLENIATRAEMLRGNQSYSLEKFKGHANTWSEEELDCLWIGVRRHGRGNWGSMLRDPKLHFAEWRVADDLAEQWDEEQLRLLNGTLIQPVALSKPDHFPAVAHGFSPKPVAGSRYGSYGTEHHTSRGQTLTTETDLSLGDVYVQKEESMHKRYPFHLSGPATALPLPNSNSPDMDPYLINRLKMAAKQQKQVKGQRSHSYSVRKRGRYDEEFPTSQQKPIGRSAGLGPWSREMFGYGRNVATLNRPSTHNMPTGLPAAGNLPHWLKEVLGTPEKPMEAALPPGVSAIAHSVSVLYNDRPVIPPFSVPGAAPVPPIDPRQQRLRRKSTINSKASVLRSEDISASAIPPAASCSNVSWMETRLSLLPTLDPSDLKPASENQVLRLNAIDLNQVRQDHLRPNDLIVIDSEASSEETISDDRSGMH